MYTLIFLTDVIVLSVDDGDEMIASELFCLRRKIRKYATEPKRSTFTEFFTRKRIETELGGLKYLGQISQLLFLVYRSEYIKLLLKKAVK